MIVSSWNCRGACGRAFPRIFKDIVKKYGVNVMGLLEPRVSGNRANKIVRGLGFTDWLRIEATGYAGGIWVLWNSGDVQVHYITSSTQLLHCKISGKNNQDPMLVTFVYGDTSVLKRRELWSSLLAISRNALIPWLVLGDGGIDHPLIDVILETRSLIYRDWDLAITHAHRETIRCADYLARNAQLSNQEFLVIETPPVECNQLFEVDCGGMPRDHSVMLTS